MKKILFSLLLFLFAFAFSPYLFADTGTVNYDLTFIEDYGYDLANGGTFESMPGYSCTGRTKIIGNSLKFTTVNAHYILFWNSSAMFIGYDIIDSGGGLIFLNSYLGDGVYNTNFVYPYGAFTFALMCDNLTDNGYINYPLSTYSGKFSSPSYLNYTDSVLTGTLADLGSYSTLYYDDVLTGSLQDAFNNPTYTDTITEYNGMTLEDIFYKGGGDYAPQDEQFLSNPHFTSNINLWSRAKCTGVWDASGYGTFTKSDSGQSFGINQNWNLTPQGHIIYMTSQVRSESADITSISLYANTSYEDMVTVNSPTVNNWYEVYTTFDNPIAHDLTIRVSAFNSTENYSTKNYVFTVDYIRAYDLTAIFGSGNEPSAEQFHYFLDVNNFNTQKAVYNLGYSESYLTDQSGRFIERSIPVLTLTNLIDNGIMVDANSNGLADNWAIGSNISAYSISAGRQKLIPSGSSYYLSIYDYTQINWVLNNSYYIGYDYDVSTLLNGSTTFVQNAFGGQNRAMFTYSIGSNYGTYVSGIWNNSYETINRAFQVFYQRPSLDGNLTTDNTIYFDNVSVFNSSTYTKTQIDNALINFGYLPYNITYYLPDMGASGTGERSFGSCGDGDVCYAVDGSGIGTDLEIYDYYTMYLDGYFTTLSGSGSVFDQWQEWRSVYGDRALTYPDTITGINPSLLPLSVQTDFTTDHTARDYYIQLYYDAVNEVERWEWYSTYGITAENYDYYAQLFVDANDPIIRWEWWKDDGITAENYDYYINPSLTHTLYLDAYNEVPRYEFFDEVTPLMFSTLYPTYLTLLTMNPITFTNFDNSVLYWQYTYSTEPDETIVESIFSFLNNINPFWVIVFAFGVMGLLAVILIYTHAPFISYIIFETLLFILFAFVGFFANWLIIIAVAIMYIIILLLVKRKTGGL